MAGTFAIGPVSDNSWGTILTGILIGLTRPQVGIGPGGCLDSIIVLTGGGGGNTAGGGGLCEIDWSALGLTGPFDADMEGTLAAPHISRR